MKKYLTIFLSCILVAILSFTVACGDKTNDTDKAGSNENTQWDYLGGGGTGESPESVDTDDDDIVSVATSVIDSISADTSSEGGTDITATAEQVKITEDGTYILSGIYSGGITIKKGLTVHLILDGATISYADGSALEGKSGSAITITAKENTVNTVSYTGSSDENAIHIKGTLAINGSGTLKAFSCESGAGKNGIKITNALTVADTTLVVEATNHAIACGSFASKNATISTKSGKDGINADCNYDNSEGKTDYEFTTEQGFVSMTNTSFTAEADGDGIQAETFVYIKGGSVNITTNPEFIAYSTANMEEYGLSSDDFRYVKSGNSYQKVADDERTSGTKYAFLQSCKGIKVGLIEYEVEDADGNTTEYEIATGNYFLVVDSGEISIDSGDDAMHVNGGNLFINGGTIDLTTFDDAMTADGLVRINGGSITILNSYEGLEGAYVEINDGTLNIAATDDGINAASDDNSITEHIIVNGGSVVVSAQGDGIDSNGSILIAGGTVVVHGPTNGGNGALDADKGIVVTGGTLYAASALGMVETPSSNSSQNVVSYAQNQSIAIGTVIKLKDADGNVLISVTTEKACQSIILSAQGLKTGSTYYIFGDDTELVSFTISGTISAVGTSQGGYPQGFPGGLNGGGRGGNGGNGGR